MTIEPQRSVRGSSADAAATAPLAYLDALKMAIRHVEYAVTGIAERWAAPVAVIDAKNGFGEEIWELPVQAASIAWRLGGGDVFSEIPGFKGLRTSGSEPKVNLQPRGTLSRYRAPQRLRFAHFYLSDELLQRAAEGWEMAEFSGRSLRHDLIMFPDDVLWQLLRAYERRSSNVIEPPSRVEMEARALLVAERLIGRHHVRRSLPAARGGLAAWQLKRACDAMEANMQCDIGLDELGKIAGCSPTHFSRAFKQSTGVAPFQWLSRRRIERAQLLLTDTKAPIADIALAVGFAAQPQFTTAFRRATGTTPGLWRTGHHS